MHVSDRRHFIKNAAILIPGFTLLPSYLGAATSTRLRIAFIGAGSVMGTTLALQDFVSVLQQPAASYLPVYAAATNSIIGPLAALSAERGGAVIDFPDFSNGKAVL
jgi:hypothetical protein